MLKQHKIEKKSIFYKDLLLIQVKTVKSLNGCLRLGPSPRIINPLFPSILNSFVVSKYVVAVGCITMFTGLKDYLTRLVIEIY